MVMNISIKRIVVQCEDALTAITGRRSRTRRIDVCREIMAGVNEFLNREDPIVVRCAHGGTVSSKYGRADTEAIVVVCWAGRDERFRILAKVGRINAVHANDARVISRLMGDHYRPIFDGRFGVVPAITALRKMLRSLHCGNWPQYTTYDFLFYKKTPKEFFSHLG